MKLGEAIPIVGSGTTDGGPTMRTAGVELEPVDHVVAGAPVGQVNVSGEMASEPAALRESNTVRVALQNAAGNP